jgi:hypothetical protein
MTQSGPEWSHTGSGLAAAVLVAAVGQLLPQLLAADDPAAFGNRLPGAGAAVPACLGVDMRTLDPGCVSTGAR